MKKHIYFSILLALSALTTISCGKVKFSSEGSTAATTPQSTQTPTPTISPTASPTPTPTATATPNSTSTPAPTSTVMPTSTPAPTATPLVSKTKSVTVQKNMTQVDILLVIDDSSSMAADNGRLGARLAGFITSLSQANLDWQMCVTTTDVSYYAGAPLIWSGTSSHILNSNIGSSLSSVVQQTIYDIGSGFSNDEQAIKATYLNVTKNAQFLCHRANSTLATIIISDEDERSVGGTYNLSSAQYKPLTTENMPDTLISTVSNQLGTSANPKKFRVNSIVVSDSTCEAKQDAEGTPSFIGKLYMDLATKTGGSIGSICDTDFTPNLNVFSGIVRNTVSSVTLDCAPVSQSVTGLPAGTTVTVQGNVMSFNPALTEGATITVNYQCNP